MEDNIVYTILILALFLLPTSVLITASLDCTYCQVPTRVELCGALSFVQIQDTSEYIIGALMP